MASSDGKIPHQNLGLDRTWKMNEVNLACRLMRRLRPFLGCGSRRGPRAKYFFHLIKNRFGRKIANQNQQSIRGRIILVIKLFELLAPERGDLFWRGSDNRVRMFAEKRAAQAFSSKKIG